MPNHKRIFVIWALTFVISLEFGLCHWSFFCHLLFSFSPWRKSIFRVY